MFIDRGGDGETVLASSRGAGPTSLMILGLLVTRVTPDDAMGGRW